MSRKKRLQQERAMLAHRAHLPLLQGMARALEKLLPPDLRYLIITFDDRAGTAGGYVSNGQRTSIAAAIRTTAERFAA